MINSIQLKNWKSHLDASFQFQPGTNVLVGSMGSGKSSILQAISFALFGTFAELKHRSIKSSEVISRSAEQKIAEIKLTLTSQNKQFEIKRKIEAKKNVSEGAIRDSEGKLVAGPQTNQVNEFVKKELGIDDEIFLRTVYAMQNDVDMILKLSPKERKKRIDELMGLNKFEIARNNCITLRNRTIRQKADATAFLESIGLENLTKKLEDMNQQIETLKSKQIGLKSELSKKKLEKDSSRINLLEMRDKFQESTKFEERKKAIMEQVSELDEKLKDQKIIRNKQDVEKELEEISNKIIIYQREKIELSTTLSKSQLDYMSADKRIALIGTKITDINSKLNKISQVKQELEKYKITDLGAEIGELKKILDNRKDEKQANIAELRELRKHLEQLALAESQCPVCSNSLNIENKTRIIANRKQEISHILYKNTELSEIVSKLEARYIELKQISEKNRYAFEELSKENELKQEFSKLESEHLENQKELVNSKTKLDFSKKRVLDIDLEIETLNSKKTILNNELHIQEIKSQRSRKLAELSLVEDELKTKKISKEDVEKQEERFQMLLKYVQELETTLSNFETLLTEKVNQISELKDQQNKADDFRNKIKELEEKAGFLDRFRNAVEATQLALRDELILAVNEVMSQVWIEIYPYDKWSAVRLASTESDYMLQIKESEGDWVPVAGFASGGERMLASLAVRIAFARVLAPGISMLILDEPTHNLDHKAVTTLIDVLQNKVSDFLDQIFIVTHEERLAENADNVIHL
jgi:DNA repair protein SbcC/Rad50